MAKAKTPEEIARKMLAEEYLHDGVYASFDGWQIKLRAPRENGDHVIYLEPQMWEELKRYVERCGMGPPLPPEAEPSKVTIDIFGGNDRS